MRELSEREISMVSGGMQRPSPPTPARGAPAHVPTDMPQLNLGTTLTCAPLASGAGYIGGTAAAIGAAVVTKNPAIVESAYQGGRFGAQFTTDAACHLLMHQHGQH